MVTKEDYGMWKMHPVTQALFRELDNLINDGITELASGTHCHDVGRTHLCIGKLNAYRSIRKLDFLED